MPAWTAVAPADPADLPAAADQSWWREARFGMFIHWGPVSLRGTEIGWSRGDSVPIEEYDSLYKRFNPIEFDARQWVRVARDAGMRYIVLTTKHHDGFCLWDSALTDYDIMSTPFARDVVAELSAACRSEGIVFCAYHSICDWRHPDYPLGSPGGKTRKPDARMDRYVDYLKGLLTELLTKYGPLGILWFDGEWEEPWTEELGRDLYRYCRTLQPSLIINNRVAKARQGMTGTSASGHFSGDYDTPEQEVGRFQTDRPWESCITLCQQWAWKPDDAMKSLEACIPVLVNCAGGDGNLLLNVGPMPGGAIEPRQTRRLAEIGRWFESNEASIRGTRGGPWRPGEWGASTHRDRDIYLHVLSPPADGVVRLAPIPRRIVRAERLDGTKVDVIATASGLAVHLRTSATIDTVIHLTLDEALNASVPDGRL
jgi:alpha-L-fucosidase